MLAQAMRSTKRTAAPNAQVIWSWSGPTKAWAKGTAVASGKG